MRDVLRGLDRTQHAIGETEDGISMPVVEQHERPLLAIPRSCQQRLVAGVFGQSGASLLSALITVRRKKDTGAARPG